jgi:hypothetical protein
LMLAGRSTGRRRHLLPPVRRLGRHMHRQRRWRWQRGQVLRHHYHEGNGLLEARKGRVLIGRGCLQDLPHESLIIIPRWYSPWKQVDQQRAVCSHPRKSYITAGSGTRGCSRAAQEGSYAATYIRGESWPRGHRRDRLPGTVQVPADKEGDIVVVDALVVPSSLLALLERHVAAVPRLLGRDNDACWPHHIILWP